MEDQGIGTLEELVLMSLKEESFDMIVKNASGTRRCDVFF